MTSNETLLISLTQCMFEKQRTYLILDELYEDEELGPFIRNIQIDSPYQQLLFAGVLSQFTQNGELITTVTVEHYFHHLLAKVLLLDERYESPESLIDLATSNPLKGIREGISCLLSDDIEIGNFRRITDLIDLSDGNDGILELCTMPFVNSLQLHGIENTLHVLLANPTNNDWTLLLNIDSLLLDLQLHELRKSFLEMVMLENPLHSKDTLWLGLKAITFLDIAEAKIHLEKIDVTSSFIQNDDDLLFQLGKMEIKFANPEKALVCHEKCLQLRIEKFGVENPKVAQSYNNIGIVYDIMGEFSKSADFFTKSLNMRLKTLPEDHTDIAHAYNNMGTSCRAHSEFDKALDFYRKSIAIDFKNYGENHPNVAGVYGNMGLVFMDKGDLTNAHDMLSKGLKILLKTMGEDQQGVSMTLSNLGIVNYNLGKFDAALEFYRRSLAIDIKILGEDNPILAYTYDQIGFILNTKGEFEEAMAYHQKGLLIRKTKLDNGHPEIAHSYNSIGMTLNKKGDHNKALEYFNLALDIRIKCFTEIHLEVADTYSNIGTTYFNLNDGNLALKHYGQALQIYTHLLGNETISVANTYCNIALVFDHYRNLEHALDFYKKCLDIELVVFGLEHPSTKETMANVMRISKEIDKDIDLPDWIKN